VVTIQSKLQHPLGENSEVAQAGAKHNKGKRRLDEQIESLSSRIWNRRQLAGLFLTGGAVLILLSSCAFDASSNRGLNMESLQRQEVVQPYSRDGKNGKLDSFYDFLQATTTPNENGQDDEIHFLYPTTEPEN